MYPLGWVVPVEHGLRATRATRAPLTGHEPLVVRRASTPGERLQIEIEVGPDQATRLGERDPRVGAGLDERPHEHDLEIREEGGAFDEDGRYAERCDQRLDLVAVHRGEDDDGDILARRVVAEGLEEADAIH